ncbi:MAG: translation initiation factor IF-3 [Candidatus Hydrogenedentes bacterium]|nr:translation initiation factor IF-3 [Candidatus Hydrogenedentota bacterium]
MNEQIRARSVRLIDKDGAQLGVMPVEEAFKRAGEAELDLVEVAPTASPPVCRIMDYGRYRYEKTKRARVSKKHQHITHVKEIKMRPKIGRHDYEFKVKHVTRFLESGDKVKVVIMYRGREMAHVELGREILKRVIEDTREISQVERPPLLEGRNMVMVLVPLR